MGLCRSNSPCIVTKRVFGQDVIFCLFSGQWEEEGGRGGRRPLLDVQLKTFFCVCTWLNSPCIVTKVIFGQDVIFCFFSGQ